MASQIRREIARDASASAVAEARQVTPEDIGAGGVGDTWDRLADAIMYPKGSATYAGGIRHRVGGFVK